MLKEDKGEGKGDQQQHIEHRPSVITTVSLSKERGERREERGGRRKISLSHTQDTNVPRQDCSLRSVHCGYLIVYWYPRFSFSSLFLSSPFFPPSSSLVFLFFFLFFFLSFFFCYFSFATFTLNFKGTTLLVEFSSRSKYSSRPLDLPFSLPPPPFPSLLSPCSSATH